MISPLRDPNKKYEKGQLVLALFNYSLKKYGLALFDLAGNRGFESRG